MSFASRVEDPDLAQRLRLMASEYLVKAEELESQMASGAHVLEEPQRTLGVGEALPSAIPEPPKK